jgi:hypothetical protein
MVASTCILSVDLKLQVLNTPSVANLHYLRWQLLYIRIEKFLYIVHTEYMLMPPYGITGRSCIIYKEPQLNDTVECTDYVINPIRTNIVNGTLYRNSFCKRDVLFKILLILEN